MTRRSAGPASGAHHEALANLRRGPQGHVRADTAATSTIRVVLGELDGKRRRGRAPRVPPAAAVAPRHRDPHRGQARLGEQVGATRRRCSASCRDARAADWAASPGEGLERLAVVRSEGARAVEAQRERPDRWSSACSGSASALRPGHAPGGRPRGSGPARRPTAWAYRACGPAPRPARSARSSSGLLPSGRARPSGKPPTATVSSARGVGVEQATDADVASNARSARRTTASPTSRGVTAAASAAVAACRDSVRRRLSRSGLEQARALQGLAALRRERGEEALLLVAEPLGALEGEPQDAYWGALRPERDGQPRLAGTGPGDWVSPRRRPCGPAPGRRAGAPAGPGAHPALVLRQDEPSRGRAGRAAPVLDHQLGDRRGRRRGEGDGRGVGPPEPVLADVPAGDVDRDPGEALGGALLVAGELAAGGQPPDAAPGMDDPEVLVPDLAALEDAPQALADPLLVARVDGWPGGAAGRRGVVSTARRGRRTRETGRGGRPSGPSPRPRCVRPAGRGRGCRGRPGAPRGRWRRRLVSKSSMKTETFDRRIHRVHRLEQVVDGPAR